jgi:hypothetical protein
MKTGTFTDPLYLLEYAAPGGGWNDITEDLLDFDVEDLAFDQGLPNFTVVIDNPAAKYKNTFLALGGSEKGLYYSFRLVVNGAELMIGRSEGVDDKLAQGNTIALDGVVVGGKRLQGQRVTFDWKLRKADDAIQDVTDYLNSCYEFGEGICTVAYTSPGAQDEITMNPVGEYAHDIIRKILERKSLTGTLRGSSATAATLDIFSKSATNRRHTSIIKRNISDDSNVVTQGALTRDLKEAANVLKVTGGKSIAEPSDLDKWTETDINAWSTKSGYGYLKLVNIPTPAVGDWMVKGVAGGPDPYFMDLRLDVAAGQMFDAIARNAYLINFYAGSNQSAGLGPGSSVWVDVELEDASGTVISTYKGTSSVGTCPLTANTMGLIQVPIGPQSLPMPRCDPMGLMLSCPWTWVKFSEEGWENGFNWRQIVRISVRFEPRGSVQPGGPQYNYYLDGFYIAQDYIPTVTVYDPIRVGKYDIREQPVDASEFTDFSELEKYALEILPAYSAPTFYIDSDFMHDPSVELLKAGWQVRFDSDSWGLASTLYWRILKINWRLKEGRFTPHIVALPATSGSEDYSNAVSGKVWTRWPGGLEKNIIDYLQKLGERANRLAIGPTVAPPAPTNFNLTCDPCTHKGDQGRAWTFRTRITAEAVNNWTGEISLDVSHNLCTGGLALLSAATITLTADKPSDYVMLTITTPSSCRIGLYKVVVTGTSEDGSEAKVEVQVRIGELGGENEACDTDDDCEEGLICVDGICKRACRGDSDCPGGCYCADIDPVTGIGHCECEEPLPECAAGTIEVPQDGTEISAELFKMRVRDRSWTVSVSDQRNYTQCGEYSYMAYEDDDEWLHVIGTFQNRCWECDKHFPFKLNVETEGPGGIMGNRTKTQYACALDVHINCEPTFVVEATCDSAGTPPGNCNCDTAENTYGALAMASWGCSDCGLSACKAVSMMHSCPNPNCWEGVYFHWRLKSVQGYSGDVTVTSPADCSGDSVDNVVHLTPENSPVSLGTIQVGVSMVHNLYGGTCFSQTQTRIVTATDGTLTAQGMAKLTVTGRSCA